MNDCVHDSANAAKAVEMVMAVCQAGLTQQRVTFPLKRRDHPLIAAVRG